MVDLAHVFGGDLATSSTGDLLTADGLDLSTQKVLRRLLTNPGDYIWRPNYGAGLPSYVGKLADAAEIQALIKAQMALEQTVAQNPPPVVTVTPITNGISVDIQYIEAESGQPITLGFSVEP